MFLYLLDKESVFPAYLSHCLNKCPVLSERRYMTSHPVCKETAGAKRVRLLQLFPMRRALVIIHDQAVKPEIQIHTTVHPYVFLLAGVSVSSVMPN